MNSPESFSPERAKSQLHQIHRATVIAQDIADSKSITLFEENLPDNSEDALAVLET